MRIAVFDIDDTVTYETEYLIKHAPRFLKKRGFCSENINPFAYSMREKYDLEQQILQQGILPETSKEEAIRLEQQFWIRNFVHYNFIKTRFGVKTLIQDLRKNNFHIFFLSVRGSGLYEGKHNAKKVVKFITAVNLRIHGIKYDNIFLVNNLEEKAEYIKYLKPELIFEDQISLLEKIQQDNEGIKGFLINNPHNERKKLPENIIRIYEFQEASEVLKSIYEGVPSKKISRKRGDYGNELFQNFMKFVAGWYFLTKYKPCITGKENIPKRGGIAFVSNHRNKLDPIFIALTSGRPIHFAALLRMFQGKEDLFRSDSWKIKKIFSAWLIRAMGALPIARDTDEKYMDINRRTIDHLTELLYLNRSIGFFPEGTINRMPYDVRLLPLKSNRVFRMAKEADSFVLPVFISWEQNKKKGSYLHISYGKPINPSQRNRKEIYDLWKKEMSEIG